jgi:CheY-like chemotaxis protein
MKQRILVAEDDPSILKMMKLRLEYEGFEVVLTVDGEQAFNQATADGVIDLILLDIKMPKLDGFEVCKRLKADPVTAKIPIILFTASEAHWLKLADRCIELGVADWIRKPFRSEDLLAKIRKVLKNPPHP